MIYNGQKVTYKFGPEDDLDIELAFGGLQYNALPDGYKLQFQLLCHAIQQVQYVEKKKWSLEKIEEQQDWEPPQPLPGESWEHAVQRPPVLVTHVYTFAKFRVAYAGRHVMTVRESFNHDYVIDFYDGQDDSWIDLILDYALDHCERFGRMGFSS